MQKSMRHFYNEEYYRQRSYDFDARYPFFNIIARRLLEEFNPKSVLDCGCAKGYLVYAFNELGIEACGIDISEYAIAQSPESVRASLFNVDVNSEKLPFEDQQFDMVTAIELVEHMQNYNHLISEIKRVLRPGGIVFITTPKGHWDIFLRIFVGREPTHINVHSKSFWIRAFESQGFHYVGDLSRDAHKEALKKAINMRPPKTKIAQFLLKFGKVGKWIREQLACALELLTRETLLFRLKQV